MKPAYGLTLVLLVLVEEPASFFITRSISFAFTPYDESYTQRKASTVERATVRASHDRVIEYQFLLNCPKVAQWH